MACSRRSLLVTTSAICNASFPAWSSLLLVSLLLLRPPSVAASESNDGADESVLPLSGIAAAAAAAAAADSGVGAGMGVDVAMGAAGVASADQFVSTEDLAAANTATDAAEVADFDPKVAGVEEEERMVEELLTWLEGRGVSGLRGENAAVRVAIDANTTLKASGRSRASMRMVAARPIAEGEVFLVLPKSIAISSSLAIEEVQPYEGQAHPFTALAAWVLRERAKGPSSLWAPFVRLLPAHLSIPVLFSDQLRTELQSQSFLMAIAEHKRMLSEEYKKCRPEAIANATEEEFLWAVGMVTSRMFTLGTGNSTLDISNSTAAGDGGSSSSDKNTTSNSSSSSSNSSATTDTALFPYADLFDTDLSPVATWQDNGTHLVFTATGNLTAGQHVALDYDVLGNDEALMFRGMVLLPNHRDRVDMFEYSEMAIDFQAKRFFKAHWESFTETDIEQVCADMDKALKGEVAKERYLGIPDEPEFKIDTSASLRVWYGGRIDPRMLGCLAAIHAHVVNKKAPNYNQLGRPAVEYGWLKDPKTTCDDYAASLDDDLGDAIPAAGAAILARAREMQQAMVTSWEGDVQRRLVVLLCKQQVLYGTYPGEKPLLCPPDFVRELPDWEVALSYRLSKKEVLSHLVSRLTGTCEA